MVLIIRREVGIIHKVVSLIFISDYVFDTFKDKHVERDLAHVGRGEIMTVFVTDEDEWTGIPRNEAVENQLVEVLQDLPLKEEEARYPIPNEPLQVRELDPARSNPGDYHWLGDQGPGDFVIWLEKIVIPGSKPKKKGEKDGRRVSSKAILAYATPAGLKGIYVEKPKIERACKKINKQLEAGHIRLGQVYCCKHIHIRKR